MIIKMIKYQKNAYEIANILRYFTYDVNCRYPDTYSIFILHTIPTRQYTFEANDYRVSSQKKNPH